MEKLVRTQSDVFKEYYVGKNVRRGREVICILDENCVRYMILAPGKHGMKCISRREYSNGQEARCFANAEKALNK